MRCRHNQHEASARVLGSASKRFPSAKNSCLRRFIRRVFDLAAMIHPRPRRRKARRHTSHEPSRHTRPTDSNATSAPRHRQELSSERARRRRFDSASASNTSVMHTHDSRPTRTFRILPVDAHARTVPAGMPGTIPGTSRRRSHHSPSTITDPPSWRPRQPRREAAPSLARTTPSRRLGDNTSPAPPPPEATEETLRANERRTTDKRSR